MKPLFVATICLALATAALFAWVRINADRVRPDDGPTIITGFIDDETHLVTPEMHADSIAMAGRLVPAIQAQDAEGRAFDLAELAENQPLLLIFIKDGCPCSVEAETYFQRLHTAYGDRVSFFGVIDGGLAVAQRWAGTHGTPFPILLDPALELAAAYHASNSAYVAVVAEGGTIETLWPGFSAGMLQELSAQLARLGGTIEQPIDVSDAPTELYSGCPFFDASLPWEIEAEDATEAAGQSSASA